MVIMGTFALQFYRFLGMGGKIMLDGTQVFNLENEVIDQNKIILRKVYDALEEKGYNSINQIVGYILSEDPTYITNYKDARALVRKLDRDELLRELVRSYLTKWLLQILQIVTIYVKNEIKLRGKTGLYWSKHAFFVYIA